MVTIDNQAVNCSFGKPSKKLMKIVQNYMGPKHSSKYHFTWKMRRKSVDGVQIQSTRKFRLFVKFCQNDNDKNTQSNFITRIKFLLFHHQIQFFSASFMKDEKKGEEETEIKYISRSIFIVHWLPHYILYIYFM